MSGLQPGDLPAGLVWSAPVILAIKFLDFPAELVFHVALQWLWNNRNSNRWTH
jgi:hypothetical protein